MSRGMNVLAMARTAVNNYVVEVSPIRTITWLAKKCNAPRRKIRKKVGVGGKAGFALG